MKRGFTLVELLAVIIVLAIIILIGVYSINRVIHNARVDTDIKLVRNIIRATESYHHEHRSYNEPELEFRAGGNFVGANSRIEGFRTTSRLPLAKNNINCVNITADMAWAEITIDRLIERGYLFEDILAGERIISFSSFPSTAINVIIIRNTTAGIGQYDYCIALNS